MILRIYIYFCAIIIIMKKDLSKFILTILILLMPFIVLVSCKKEIINTDSSFKLKFSSDTIIFDTVFTTIGSVTKQLKVFNTGSKKINISSIRLSGSTKSNFSINVDENISELLNIAKETNRFHDELSTDICFIVDWFYIRNGRLYISNEIDIVPTALSEYYKCNHEDEAMRMYRPVIRSTFQGLCNLDCSKEFSEKIWKILGKISECNPLVIVWDEEKEKMEFYKNAS